MSHTTEESDRADALCRRLDTYIPGSISAQMWSLPLLEALVARVERLEQALLEFSTKEHPHDKA
jgi:hypothetical protein